MARVKRGTTVNAKHKKVLERASGFRGRNHTAYKIARERVEKAGQYAYRDRKVRKRNFRALWIQRINAGVRLHGLTYSQFMNGLKKANIELDRKVMAEMAYHNDPAFEALIASAKRFITDVKTTASVA